MSWEAQAWVWDLELKAKLKWVLMGIANYVDQDLKCWPSLKTLSDRLGMTKQSVITNLNELVEMKLLEKERDQHYGVNHYRLSKAGQKFLPDIKTVKKSLTDNEKQVKNFELKQIKNFDSNLISSKPITKKESIDHFETFWREYPRKVAKPAALKAWTKGKCDSEINRILPALKQQRQSKQWQQNNGQYIPHPATWLNNRRWEDAVEVAGVSGPGEELPVWR